jgi:UDP-N-acetylmuramyl tripeptide synthase
MQVGGIRFLRNDAEGVVIMKVLDIKTTNGPNYWSVKKHKLVVTTLDIEELEQRPTHLIPGFLQRLQKWLPTLKEHRCSEGVVGGFFMRVQQGTWMGHVIEHIALELQWLAGIRVAFGKTRSAGTKGVYYVVFAYVDKEAGVYAAHAAIRIADALVKGIDYNVANDVNNIKDIALANCPCGAVHAVLQEARKRNIPVIMRNNNKLVQLGYASEQALIQDPVSSTAGAVVWQLYADENYDRELLFNNFIPFSEKHNKTNGSAHLYDTGFDFQVLVINYRFVAAVLLKAASVFGNAFIEVVTDEVHEHNKALFERIARLKGLNICTIDIRALSLKECVIHNQGVITGIQASPDWRIYLQPAKGQPVNVGKPIVDMFFPDQSNGRIPIVAVTGTNGKTTTTRLIAHIAKVAGYNCGCTTTDGIYINNRLVVKGDSAGPLSALTLLTDPGINMAVLECARGGILRSGLAFDSCDVGIVTNIGEDHLGMNGIDDLDDLAKVKSVVPESVKEDGFAILNADDEHVFQMKEGLRCKVALFSLKTDNAYIETHHRNGGVVAVYEKGFITIKQGANFMYLGSVKDIPLTFGGKAVHNIANILPAVLAAYVQKIPLKIISRALKSFTPDPVNLPGRMNAFYFNGFTVFVDYAHNSHGMKSIAPLVLSFPASIKTGVITGVGDRRDEDIVALAEEAAKIFDEIIIRHDKDLRGRTKEQIDQLIHSGVYKVARKKITVVSDELQVVDDILANPVENSVTVIFADDISAVTDRLERALKGIQANSAQSFTYTNSYNYK